MAELSRLSLNQITTDGWSLAEAAAGCRRAGLDCIGVWRHKIEDLAGSAAILRDYGLSVSGLCRGGMFPAATAAERQKRIDDNLKAIDEAAVLGTDVLVLVNGTAPDRDIRGARRMVEDGICAVIEHAAARGVKLGIEPLHPVYAGDRSVVVTLGQANSIAESISHPGLGVVVDVFHVWWDPDVEQQIRRAGPRILGFHVSDWPETLPDVLMGRVMMGDGKIEIRRLRELVDGTGYAGPIEVEIFNRDVWDTPGDEVLALMKERFISEV